MEGVSMAAVLGLHSLHNIELIKQYECLFWSFSVWIHCTAACLCVRRLPWICTLLWIIFKSNLYCYQPLECTFAPGRLQLNHLPMCMHVCVCACVCINPAINVSTVSNGPITRHKLVSNNTQAPHYKHQTRPTNGINFVIKDTYELVRALVSAAKFYPEEEGGDHSVVCKGPAPWVHDSCSWYDWVLLGETPGSDLCLFLCCRAIHVTRCHRKGMPSGKYVIAFTRTVMTMWLLGYGVSIGSSAIFLWLPSTTKCENLCFCCRCRVHLK